MRRAIVIFAYRYIQPCSTVRKRMIEAKDREEENHTGEVATIITNPDFLSFWNGKEVEECTSGYLVLVRAHSCIRAYLVVERIRKRKRRREGIEVWCCVPCACASDAIQCALASLRGPAFFKSETKKKKTK